ncbi:MAG: AAA family ATPase [Deferribacterales bacterium]
MAVITISRQYGCGGEYVAERIAEKLGFKFLHKELIRIASVLMSTDEEKLKQFDEEEFSSMRSFMSKYFDLGMFADMLGKTDYSEKTAKEIAMQEAETFFEKYNPDTTAFDSDSFQAMIKKIIVKAADTTNSVIMGRGGVSILADVPDTLHFRLIAFEDDRIRWVSARENISKKDAKDRIAEVDKRKEKYFKHHFNQDINDQWMYHGTLNLSKLDIEEASLAITAIAKIKFKL